MERRQMEVRSLQGLAGDGSWGTWCPRWEAQRERNPIPPSTLQGAIRSLVDPELRPLCAWPWAGH